MASNSIPELLDRLRPTLQDVADWAHVSRALVVAWRAGLSQPRKKARVKLVANIRKHAANLSRLAEAVEREGEARALAARSRPQRRSSGRASVSETVRRGATKRSPPGTRERRRRRGGAE